MHVRDLQWSDHITSTLCLGRRQHIIFLDSAATQAALNCNVPAIAFADLAEHYADMDVP